MGLVIDLFAGGGGASLGIEDAGLRVDIAVNHDPPMIEVHRINHPLTKHYVEDVYKVDPIKATGGQDVDLLWASPNCTHHSRALGGKPRDRKNRSLGFAVVRWAKAVRPRLIVVENVIDWLTWGPLDEHDQPRPDKVGHTWRRWCAALRRLGYRLEYRVLSAADFGVPTTRERLYVVARLDGAPCWPVQSHAAEPGLFGLARHRAAAECIDFRNLGVSIFDRAEPLVDNTLHRVARGIRKFVLCADPFIVDDYIAATMVHIGNGERAGQAPRVYDIRKPLPTAVAGGVKQELVIAFLARHFGGHGTSGSDLREPMRTVTTQDHHGLVAVTTDGQPDRSERVAAFLMTYYSTATGSDLRSPIPTITTHDRFALVSVRGQQRRITDILTRHLMPRELARGQGFGDDYVLDPVVNGKRLSRSAQVHMIGNSVCRRMAALIVGANRGAVEHRRAA